MNRRILNLALPNIVSNISIPMLGIVDMALMGRMESDSYIGAIALGSLIFNFIYWGLGFLRMGTSGFTAQAFGKKDFGEAIMIFARALLLSLAIGLFLLIIQRPLEWLSFRILNGETRVEELASQYFRIRIWAAPAALGQFVFLGWFLGMQNARLPMYVLVTTNIINIIANWLLVIVAGMGSEGVALGTVIAQYCGLLLAIFLFVRNFRYIFSHFERAAMVRLERLREFLLVNRDIFIRTMCLVLVFSFFTARSATADTLTEGEETILAVNSLLMQFFMFFSFLIDGFSHASEALTGKYIGAADSNSLRKLIRLLFLWGAGISLVFMIIYGTAGRFLLGLLTTNQEIISNALPYLFWVLMIPATSFSAFLWDGIYIGATAGPEMRNSMLISTIVIFFPAYLILSRSMGNHGLWFAFVLFMISRTITMSLLSRRAVYSKVHS